MEIEIEGTFGNLSWDGGSFYTCEVKSPLMKERYTKVTSSKGVHQAGKSNADVEAIYFDGLVMEYFPLDLHDIFPNLKQLIVFNCGLKEISRRDLWGLESLTGLFLGSNQLISLSDNLLRGMKNLTRIYFHMNKLEYVSSKLLKSIQNNNLIRVDFISHPTKIGFYAPGFPGSLKSLQELGDVIDKNFKKPMLLRAGEVAKDYQDRLVCVRSYKEFWTTGCFSDFVIVCESKEFKVHKLILAMQSPVLAEAFQRDMQESKTGRMEIKDFSKEAVEDFLKYMYTGEAPAETNAMEIFALASKYNVPALKSSMEDIVLRNIDETNAIEILSAANQHGCAVLAQQVFNKIQEMFPDNELDPSLIDNPEKLKQLIDSKRK